MILTADLGNSALKLAAFEGESCLCLFSLSARRHTVDEWHLLMKQHFAAAGICPENAFGAVLGSVAPHLTESVKAALVRLCGKEPLVIGAGVKTGLDIRTDHQAELGADIVANAVAARQRVLPPFIVADFGTATTVSAVDENGVFRGVAILPGVGSAARDLARTCANLPEIIPGDPVSLLGKNTRDSLNGGLCFGFAAMADALTDRVKAEIGADSAALIATGFAAERILPLCKNPFTYVPRLTSEGLARLYELNRVRKA